MDSPEPSLEQLEVRQRAIGLFGFLHAIAELRSKTVRSIDSYEDAVWFSEIPREKGCYCVAWHLGQEKQPEDVWIEVRKPRLRAAPQPPDSLRPWLRPEDVANSSLDFPALSEHVIVASKTSDNAENEELTYEYLKDFPDVSKLWERYVEEKWWPWAEEDKKLRAVQSAYTDHFSIYQKQQRLGEQYEVVVGLGLLKWKTPHSQEVNRHIVVGQTSLSFDADRGVISLGPAGEGPRPIFEMDMLEVQDRPEPDELKALENQLNECGDELWDPVHVHSILRGWVHAVSPRGEFIDTLDRPNEVKDDPRVYFAPAVI
ncbi:MAG: hypothetical protein HY801_09250, partial [Candidatus Lindowbacteria bacterium]|nr:hypothetical protein [Candidatus Lindowbacteria bacterium]